MASKVVTGRALMVLVPMAALVFLPTAAFAADTATHDPVVEPDTYRTDEYRKPVPATLKGATVLSPAQASALWASGGAVFIDVYPHAPKPDNLPANTIWREPQHFSIEGAKWLANVGYGVLSPATDDYYRHYLAELTNGNRAAPIVIFCLRNCWMSWNAAKRAVSYGYTNVLWFSEGTDAWQEIAQPVAEVTPEPELKP